MNGAVWVFQPPDSIVFISLPFGFSVSPLEYARFLALSSGGMHFNCAVLSFCCIPRAVFSFMIDIGLTKSAMANYSSVFVFSLTMSPFKSSLDRVVVFLILKDSTIAITENLSIW